MNPRPFYTRREFLRGSVLGGALSWTVPGFVQATLSSLQADAAERAGAATGKQAPILVLLQLAGGNPPDGGWMLENTAPQFVASQVMADLQPGDPFA